MTGDNHPDLNASSPPPPREARGWLITARGGVGTIADIVSIATAIVATWSLVSDGPVPQAILAIGLGFLALAFMGLSFHLQRRQAKELVEERRRARHSESLAYMTESAAVLRDAMAILAAGGHPTTFEEPAKRAVTSLAQAMTVATGCKCRIVVKIIYAPGGRDDVAVKTFATSEPTRPRRGAPTSIDWVKENTDFDEIFYRDSDYFLSNDLKSELGYKNSHFNREVLERGYPYRSTIVWPIYGYREDRAQVLGFLCVDTKATDAFDQDRDVVVGETMASFWYLALQRYKESVDAADAAEKAAEDAAENATARALGRDEQHGGLPSSDDKREITSGPKPLELQPGESEPPRSGPQRSEDTRSGDVPGSAGS